MSVPAYDHIVVAIMENHDYSEIIGNREAPYINGLAAGGALLSNYTAITIQVSRTTSPCTLAARSASPTTMPTASRIRHLRRFCMGPGRPSRATSNQLARPSTTPGNHSRKASPSSGTSVPSRPATTLPASPACRSSSRTKMTICTTAPFNRVTPGCKPTSMG
jgi:hypothetical protein